MTTEAETELLAELTAVVSDLHSAQSWAGFKSTLTDADIMALLQQIDAEGNSSVHEEKGRHAYALQALALSLASTNAQQDTTKAGAALLDQVIEAALKNYRTQAKPS